MDHEPSTTRSDLESMLLDEASEPKAHPLSILAEITNDFPDKQEIDGGGFAVLCKVCTEKNLRCGVSSVTMILCVLLDQITAGMYIIDLICSLDAHPTEPWKQWVLAGTSDGFVHVYHCDFVTEPQKITSFSASSFDSLAVHSSKPYVFSSGWGMTLWDWDKGWQCAHDFDCVANKVAFNPQDANSFASAAYGANAEIWSLDSGCQEYDLPGHSKGVNCLDFFTRDGRQYLITGSDDCTAKIWDLQNKSCIHTLETMSPVTSVVSLPDAPYLITGSKTHIVHVWSSTDFRLERIVNIGGGMWSGSDDLGHVHSLGIVYSLAELLLDKNLQYQSCISMTTKKQESF
ncbi:coatomer subunit beta'-1-like [Triticum aestivum]|uniref:coatomer subunit beta'-1-like n=1 Tax=Triticum aestivum TaxID=4565 RepID=UPI001D003DD3|nr:coatomer subunit beta'-1-like [Triticum aestivum]